MKTSAFAAIVTLAAALSGCFAYGSMERRASAPALPPSASLPRVVQAAPEGTVELGTIEATGPIFASAQKCEEQILRETQAAGATAVIIQHSTIGLGSPRCFGRAYGPAKSTDR